MKTIAGFKRRMKPGTHWETVHQFIGDDPTTARNFGVRECVSVNTVGFGIRTTNGPISFTHWPKKTEFVPISNTEIQINFGFGTLNYKFVSN